MAKWWATELQVRVVNRCLQLHGGYGYMREYPVARDYEDCRISDDLRRHHRDHEGDRRPGTRAVIGRRRPGSCVPGRVNLINKVATKEYT